MHIVDDVNYMVKTANATSPAQQTQPLAEAVRHFNRFYTREIGTLKEGLLESSFSLTEARVLYELAERKRPTASEISRELDLDAGYLSRILVNFERRGLLGKQRSEIDSRQSLLNLTKRGRREFTTLDDRSTQQARKVLDGLPDGKQQRLIEAMQTIQRLLDPREAAQGNLSPYVLREHQSGDMGWVVHRHGLLYRQEYGWDERFEALVARIVADFIDYYDPKRERCWIAERAGEKLGCIFLIKHPEMPEHVAKLRLLLVEPSARGLGIGRHLVKECTTFARQANYHKIVLWTNSILSAARRIYEEAGYRLVNEEPPHSYGHNLIGQTWELPL